MNENDIDLTWSEVVQGEEALFILLSTGYIVVSYTYRETSSIQKEGTLTGVQQGVNCLKIGRREAFDDYPEMEFMHDGATRQDNEQAKHKAN